MAPAPKPLHLAFEFERETKNKVRFSEVDEKGAAVPKDKAAVEKLYVNKDVLKALGNPGALKVTVTAG